LQIGVIVAKNQKDRGIRLPGLFVYGQDVVRVWACGAGFMPFSLCNETN
jgi:hypothetical protein